MPARREMGNLWARRQDRDQPGTRLPPGHRPASASEHHRRPRRSDHLGVHAVPAEVAGMRLRLRRLVQIVGAAVFAFLNADRCSVPNPRGVCCSQTPSTGDKCLTDTGPSAVLKTIGVRTGRVSGYPLFATSRNDFRVSKRRCGVKRSRPQRFPPVRDPVW